LTIDLKIQGILEKLVGNIIARQPGVKAGAYLMDAGSGAMVASVQYPAYNPNNYREYPEAVLSNLFLEPMLLPVQIRRFLRDAALLNSQNEVTGAQLPWSLIPPDESLGSQVRLWDRIGLNEPLPPEFIEDGKLLSASSEMHEIVAKEEENFDTVPEFLTPLQLLTSVTCLLNSGEKSGPGRSHSWLMRRPRGSTPCRGGRNPSSVSRPFQPRRRGKSCDCWQGSRNRANSIRSPMRRKIWWRRGKNPYGI